MYVAKFKEKFRYRNFHLTEFLQFSYLVKTQTVSYLLLTEKYLLDTIMLNMYKSFR